MQTNRKQILDDINILKEKHISEHNFVTESSKSIPYDFMISVQNSINRASYVIQLNGLLRDMNLATQIEEGIFEFSLTHIINNNLRRTLFNNIYVDKFNDLFLNLDVKSRLNNKTARALLKTDAFKPQFLAFLSPQQLHPEKWSEIIKKKEYIIDKEKNVATTDQYTCKKCGESKCSVSQLQTRGADEPITTFITCCVCYDTVTLELEMD